MRNKPLGCFLAVMAFSVLLSVATSIGIIVLIVMAIRWLAASMGGTG